MNRRPRFLLALLTAFISGVGCSHSNPKADSEPPLTRQEIKADIDYTINILQNGYVGSRFLEKAAFDSALKNLEHISKMANLTPRQLAEQLGQALSTLPDQHFVVYRFENGKFKRFNKLLRKQGTVGNNLQTNPEREWNLVKVKTPKGRSVDVLAISTLMSGMNLENPHWKELLGHAPELFKKRYFIVDFRGNDGGSQMVLTAFNKKMVGKDRVIERKRSALNTVETMEMRKAFSEELIDHWIKKDNAESIAFEKQQIQEYDRGLEMLKQNRLSRWEDEAQTEAGENPTGSYRGTVYILMDGKTASAAEFAIAQFDTLFKTVKIGTNTEGAVHYAYTGAAILPHSQIRLRVGTHYYPIRYGFIETKGITPDIPLEDGADALQRALQEIDRQKSRLQ